MIRETMFDGKNPFHPLHLQKFGICNEEGLSRCKICKLSLQILGKTHMDTLVFVTETN